MTLAEVADVGIKRFEEYAEKHKLKVKGIEPYDASTVKEKKKGIGAPLSRLTEDIVKDAVDEVLDELAKVGEFTMSERDAMWDVQTEPRRHGNLRMTFEHGRDSKDNSVLWIYCWYYLLESETASVCPPCVPCGTTRCYSVESKLLRLNVVKLGVEPWKFLRVSCFAFS